MPVVPAMSDLQDYVVV
uniref:Uncharacterized protein n=1 Tax=Anguilla anguilla TaxID=7936 RepID=A0A0E9UHC5_ANGAN